MGDVQKYFYLVALIGLPLLVFIIYWSLLKGLSVMEIRQCLPYMEGDQPYSMNPLTAISIFSQMTLHYHHIQLDKFHFCRDHQCQRALLPLSAGRK